MTQDEVAKRYGSTNGRMGYVYSPTRNERKTIGGETIVMEDKDLFRAYLDRPAAGLGLFDRIEPRFNRLVLFDDRVPHAVQRVEGSMDPVEGRFVLHGHLSEAGVVAQGGLHANQVKPVTEAALRDVRKKAPPSVKGPLVIRLTASRRMAASMASGQFSTGWQAWTTNMSRRCAMRQSPLCRRRVFPRRRRQRPPMCL